MSSCNDECIARAYDEICDEHLPRLHATCAKPLKWTREEPSEVGWYWTRRRYSALREPVLDVQKVTYDMLGPGDWGDTEFAGPMMPPPREGE